MSIKRKEKTLSDSQSNLGECFWSKVHGEINSPLWNKHRQKSKEILLIT